MSRLSEDLGAAKALLLEVGRCTDGAYGEDERSVCPIIAIHDVVGKERLPNGDYEWGRADDCCDALTDQLPWDDAEGRRRRIVEWNESPETTDEAFYAAFDRAIAASA